MNDRSFEFASGIVSSNYISQGKQGIARREKLISNLLSHRNLPETPWDEMTIQTFLNELAMMDSNNFVGNVGLGEREARVFSPIVSRRNFNLAHGIGRSGDVSAEQPKAAGSSLINKLTNMLVHNMLKIAGYNCFKGCLVVPMATGMSVTLTLLAMRKKKPEAKYIIWTRIDQKSCFKAIATAGYTPIVVNGKIVGDSVETDLETIENEIIRVGAENVLCVLTTTSCFAPRIPDNVEEVAKICSKTGVGHVINNAYGVQSSGIAHAITQACKKGRVDAVVQSTDKNFMVPVGGAVITGPSAKFIDEIAQTYPGRASAAPLIDMLITCLAMGQSGWKQLLKQRKDVFKYLTGKLEEICSKNGLTLLKTKNPISLAVSMNNLMSGLESKDQTFFGAMLFQRGISGTRLVSKGAEKTIEGVHFKNFGGHHPDYPHSYMNAAGALGLTMEDVDDFVVRFDATIRQFKKKIISKPTIITSEVVEEVSCSK
eukprot:TRINITY_DN781847_c0_g1_i1.p1 TRINITY_DN781847_c0_g1~~TRINITY_DN781847_c0_g1_i1.p1  ORF type:complete len:485 (-),score=113.30 TRINITY_DN781847_c0_g1_i1:154-1608(-)